MRRPSSTKGSWPVPLPRLEQLLLDTDINVQLRPYLDAVGFRTQSALDTDADVRIDAALLRWATRHRHILVCHDRHRDQSTRLGFYNELYMHGGKVIRISKDSSQDVLEALGKLLVHRPQWKEFFARSDGEVVVSRSERARCTEARRLYTRYVQPQLELNPEETIRQRRPSPERARRRRSPPPEQQRLT